MIHFSTRLDAICPKVHWKEKAPQPYYLDCGAKVMSLSPNYIISQIRTNKKQIAQIKNKYAQTKKQIAQTQKSAFVR